MADPVTKTFDTIVQGEAAAVQARGTGLVDFSVGSIVRASLEAVSGVVLWLQGLILVLLAATRLSTSPTDADADSFVADFGAAPLPGDPVLFQRLGAQAASGHVTFTRLSTSGTAIILPGATVSSLDGSQQYAVSLDTTLGSYNSGLGGYVMAATVGSLILPVEALVAGSAGNAVAGAINTITSAIPGVDAVTNAAGFTNGFDKEQTPAMLVRWRQLFQALRHGTPAALAFAVTSLQRGVTAQVIENVHFDGTAEKGYSYLLVDDGTGFPSSDLLTAAGAAVDAVHAAGTSFNIYAPSVLAIDVVAALVTNPNAVHADVVAGALGALSAFLDTLPISSNVYWSRIWQVLHDSSPDIVEVTGLTVNTGTVDIAMTVNQVAKAGTLAIT